jgi:hypothetical protein
MPRVPIKTFGHRGAHGPEEWVPFAMLSILGPAVNAALSGLAGGDGEAAWP